jgi:hypothetical protein
MPEELRHDPVLGKLAQFTPDRGHIDRDGLLFAAGRASAPKARGWKIAVFVLAISQAAILIVWIAGIQTTNPPLNPSVRSIDSQNGLPSSEPSTNVPDPAGSYVEIVRRWERDALPPPAPIADPNPPDPILSVAAGQRALESD